MNEWMNEWMNEMNDKACIQHDMAYEDFKTLAKGTALEKVLRDRSFNIAKNSKYGGGPVSLVYKFFDKKFASLTDKSAKGAGVKSAIKQNEQLTEELHKLIIKKFEKRKVYSSFKDSIWGANFSEMQLISKFNERNCFFMFYYHC